MARLPIVGGDDGNWGQVLNDYLSESHSDDGTLKNASVGAPQLKPNAVTNAAIADGTIQQTKLSSVVQAKLDAPADLASGAVTTDKLADDAVTPAKTSAFGSANGFASLDADGRLPETQIPARLGADELSAAIGAGVTSGALGLVPRSKASPSVWPGGRTRLYAGDSITNGSSASSSANFYTTKASLLCGTETLSVVRAGFPGERADQIAARLPGLIETNAPNAVHFQAGTNDLGQNRTVTQFLAALDAAKAACDAAGIPMTTGTVFARASSFSGHLLLAAYNLALRTWCIAHDVPFVDTYGATADPLTGYLRADFDSGDGVHPNDAGHAAIATAIAAFMFGLARRKPFPVTSKQPGNLITNPLQDSTLSGWSVKAGTGPTSSWVASSAADDLTAGGWRQFTYDNSAGSSQLNYTVAQNIDMTGVEVGDKLLMVAKYEVDGTAGGNLQVTRGSTNVSRPVDGFRATPLSGSVSIYTVQAADIGQTMSWGLSAFWAAGASGSIRLGQMGVFNLTKLGVT